MVLRALIVDDEPFVRADLRHLLALHPDVSVEGEAGTFEECEDALASKPFDVVFLDIQLRGCEGFDIVPLVRPQSEIIFVTAFDRYAVRAFEVNALDYLIKPVEPKRLAAALDRLRARNRGVASPQPVPAASVPTDRILLRTDSERRFVPISSIAAIASLGGNYTEVYLVDPGVRPAVRQSLKTWEENLPEGLFVRIHRSALINVQAVERIVTHPDGGHHVHLRGQASPFSVSRRCAATFLREIEKRATPSS